MNSPYCDSCITHCLPFQNKHPKNSLPGLLVPLNTAQLQAQDLAHGRFIRNTYLVSEEELSSDTKPLSPLLPQGSLPPFLALPSLAAINIAGKYKHY